MNNALAFYTDHPTAFVRLMNDMTTARGALFEPVLTGVADCAEDEAVRSANDTMDDFCACVPSNNIKRARAIARHIRTHMGSADGARLGTRAPFGDQSQAT